MYFSFVAADTVTSNIFQVKKIGFTNPRNPAPGRLDILSANQVHLK